MSALGHKRTLIRAYSMSALLLKADPAGCRFGLIGFTSFLVFRMNGAGR
jgi:hypothetical protein